MYEPLGPAVLCSLPLNGSGCKAADGADQDCLTTLPSTAKSYRLSVNCQDLL
jgi:hypothetical protein